MRQNAFAIGAPPPSLLEERTALPTGPYLRERGLIGSNFPLNVGNKSTYTVFARFSFACAYGQLNSRA